MTGEPAWFTALVDQRMALLADKLPPKAVPDQTSVIMTPLSDPPPILPPSVWERTCDGCGLFCPDDVPFYTGHITRQHGPFQVVIVFGVCEHCHWQ